MAAESPSGGALAAALDALREPLPFAPARLSEPRVRDLDRFLAGWGEACGLGGPRSREVVRVYVEHCSPASADPPTVEMAAEFLLWFFALNDVPDGREKQEALDRVYAILNGDEVEAPPFTAATRRFRRRIHALWPDAPRLSAALQAMFAAFSWEIEHVGETPPTELYQKNREHTVAVHPYITIFRLGLGVPEPDARWAELEVIERLSVEIVYLVNDILSVARDHRKNKQNFVFCLAREHGVAWADAVPLAVRHLGARIDMFREGHDRILASSDLDAPRRAYVSFLASYLEGNRVATLALQDRYFGNG